MGSSESRASTQDLLDVKRHDRFNKASPEVLSWVQETGDCILGFGGCLSTLAQKVDMSAVSNMNKVEKERFGELETEKICVVGRIKMFIMKEKIRFQIMSEEAQIGSKVSELTRNVRPEKHCQEIAKLQEDLTRLQMRYTIFSRDLQAACKEDGRSASSSSENIVKVVAVVTTAVAAIAVAVFLVIHFAPVIPVVLTAGHWAVVGGCGCVAVAGATVLSKVLQPTEIERALGYMKDLQKNLEKLKISMQDIEAKGATIGERKELAGFQQCAKELVNQCTNIEKICDEVSKQTFCT